VDRWLGKEKRLFWRVPQLLQRFAGVHEDFDEMSLMSEVVSDFEANISFFIFK
jgi:hypothetical protein